MFNFEGSQKDVTAGDVAGGNIDKIVTHVYNVTTTLEQVTQMLSDSLSAQEERLVTLEHNSQQHQNERQALTRLIINLAHESRSVEEVHRMLAQQIDSEREERFQRRRYLDAMLSILTALAVLNLLVNIYRVIRMSGRRASP